MTIWDMRYLRYIPNATNLKANDCIDAERGWEIPKKKQFVDLDSER